MKRWHSGPKKPLSVYTEREDTFKSWRSGKLFPSNLLTLIINYLWVKSDDSIFLGSKITVNGDCNHEIKRCLLLESYDKSDNLLKSRDITLPTKVHTVETTVFPGVTYKCESWTIKKAEHQRIDAFELWCWKRLLRVPWTARRSNQSILKEINPEYSLEGLMLKLQCFGHLMWISNSLDPDAGKDWRRGSSSMRWLDSIHHQLNGHEREQTPGDNGRPGSPPCCSPWDCKESDVT